MFNLIKSLPFILFALLLYGCSTSPNSETVVNTSVDIIFIDKNGKELLNPNELNAITEQNTDLYYLINGEKQKIFKGHLECPKMFCINNTKDNNTTVYNYIMKVFANTIRGQKTATTYLEFEDGSMDTIKVAYVFFGAGNNSVTLTKIWYNGKLKASGEGEWPPVLAIQQDFQ